MSLYNELPPMENILFQFESENFSDVYTESLKYSYPKDKLYTVITQSFNEVLNCNTWLLTIFDLVDTDLKFIKTTKGLTPVNYDFVSQVTSAHIDNKQVGFIHSLGTMDPIKQADHFIHFIKPYIKEAMLILKFDDEAVTHGSHFALTFLERVEAKTGIKPCIYMKSIVEEQFDWENVYKKYSLYTEKKWLEESRKNLWIISH